jgi:hypothetical protein
MLWDNPQRNLAPALDTGGRDLPTTFGETFSAAWSRNTLFSQDYTGENDRWSALSDYTDKIKAMSGRDVASELNYGTGEFAPDSRAMLAQVNTKLAELKKQNPDLDLDQLTPEQFEQNAIAKRRKADADFEEIINRPRGSGATVGRWFGAGAAGVADPINIAALPIAPEAELGVLASAVRWGKISGGAGVAGTALAAPYREAVQPGYIASGAPIAEVAEQTVMGAAGGALFPAAVALGRPIVNRLADAWDRVRGGAWPTSVKDAGNIVSSQANINQSNIYPGIAGSVAHEQALAKTTNDILAGRPVDVSQHITPELEAAHAATNVDAEANRLQAQASAKAAERPVPIEPAPELPFERTALEAKAEGDRQSLVLDIYDAARNQGHDIPFEDADNIARKMLDATPEEARKIFRDLQMSPRQVADAPHRIDPPAEPVPTFVPPVEDIHAPDFLASVRADLDRELAAPPVHPEPRSLKEIDAGAAPTQLPEQHELYFHLDANTRMVPVEDLISSKTPEENAKGAANGAKRMAASAAGEIGRRAPITVRPLPDGKFLVLDGNGTLTAATNYGWRHMPVKLEESPIAHLSSESGMPMRAARAGETGIEAPGTKSSSVTEPLASTQPAPRFQTSMRPEPLASFIQRATIPSTTMGPRFSDFAVGDIDPASDRNILQGSNDYKAIHAKMAENAPLVDARIRELVAKVPGTEFHKDASRVKKLTGPTGLEEKIKAKGRPANTISDYLGARVVADSYEAIDEFAQRLHDTGAVIEEDNSLHTSKDGYRARHFQINLDDGTSFELQLVPRPIAEVIDPAHDIRQDVKRLKDLGDPDGKAAAVMKRVEEIFDGAWAKAAHWVAGRPPERIEGVAIRDRDTGQVWSKPNVMHVDMYEAAAKDLGMSYEDAFNARTAVGSRARFDEGFTTNTGRYVGRQQASEIAQRMGQTYGDVRTKGLDAGDLKPIETNLPHGLATFSPYELGVDPNKFQFKAGTDEQGVSDRLKDVKTWDPIKAGTSIVWVDKIGKAWIVDGHQRLGLARRIAAEDPAQDPRLMAYTLREDEGYTPERARAIAAMTNISQGTGTAVDAAKVLRDHPELAGELPPRSELVKQARGLVNLSPDAFGMVVNDVVPANYAAIVGRLVPEDPQMQRAIIQLLAKTDPANAVQAEAIARQGIEAGLAKAEAGKQISLFGDQEVAQSLYLERAKVLDRALKTLRKDKTVFGTLVKEAETLEGAGNVLAKDINEQRAIADGQALQILQTLANRAGPISDALRTAAGKAGTDGYASATREFVAAVRELHASGELVRAANSLERGASHVGSENTTELIDRGLAAEPSKPAAIDAAEQDVKYAIAAARRKPGPSISAAVGSILPAERTAAERELIRLKDEDTAASKKLFDLYERGASDAAIAKATAERDRTADALRKAEGDFVMPPEAALPPSYERGVEGKPQAIMPGMEPSARQLAAARAGPMRGRVPQEEPGELFSPQRAAMPDMFTDARGQPQNFADAMRDVDQTKMAADQIAACAGPPAEMAG